MTYQQYRFSFGYGLTPVIKKLMITIPESGVGFNRPWHENHDLVLRWYDHWLKGIDTGIMNEPPIKIFLMGANQWRYEHEWPLSRTRRTEYYLRTWEGLSLEPETHPDIAIPIIIKTTNNPFFNLPPS